MHHIFQWLFFICLLFFSSCFFDGTLQEPKIEITKISYSIDLTAQDDQGFYIAKPNQLIQIQATAKGPHQESIQWNTSIPIPLNGELNIVNFVDRDIIKTWNYLKSPIKIDKGKFVSFDIKDGGSATEYKIRCFAVGQEKIINGVELIQGEQEFKVRITE